jgi:hypothetical protein
MPRGCTYLVQFCVERKAEELMGRIVVKWKLNGDEVIQLLNLYCFYLLHSHGNALLSRHRFYT